MGTVLGCPKSGEGRAQEAGACTETPALPLLGVWGSGLRLPALLHRDSWTWTQHRCFCVSQNTPRTSSSATAKGLLFTVGSCRAPWEPGNKATVFYSTAGQRSTVLSCLLILGSWARCKQLLVFLLIFFFFKLL